MLNQNVKISLFFILWSFFIMLGLAIEFDWQTANVSLYHAESAYCDPTSYLTRQYKGILKV